MGRIKAKRVGLLPTCMQPMVDSIAGAGNDQALAEALLSFEAPSHFERPEERSLMNWIEVLNTIDEVLMRRVLTTPVRPPLLSPSTSTTPITTGVGHATVPRSSSARLRSQAPQNTSDEFDVPQHPGAVAPSSSPSLEIVLSALRVSLRLVRNASHDTKQLYSSVDTMIYLLGDPHQPIVILSLEILHALNQRSQRIRAARSSLAMDLISRLYALSHGFGGRENGLGLVECCSENFANGRQSLPEQGASIHLDFRRDDISLLWNGQLGGRGNSVRDTSLLGEALTSMSPALPDPAPSTLFAAESEHREDRDPSSDVVSPETTSTGEMFPSTTSRLDSAISANRVDIQDVRSLPNDEASLLVDFTLEKGVPKEMQFPLLAAYRRARAFVDGREARIENVRIRLLAIATLAQLQPLPPAFSMVFSNDHELIADVVALAKSDAADGLETIPLTLRVVAFRCLTATCSDRHRISQLINCTGLGSHHGVLPSLLRAQVVKLLAAQSDVHRRDKSSNSSNACSTKGLSMEMDGTEVVTPASFGSGEKLGRVHVHDVHGIVDTEAQSVQLSEAVIGLVHALAMSTASQGSTALVASGALGTIVPILGDRNPRHTRAVSQAIRAMECIIENTHASAGSSAFRDHGGISQVVDRIVTEVGSTDSGQPDPALDSDDEDERVERGALESRKESRGLYELLGRRQLTPSEALQYLAPSSSTASRGLLSHSKWALLRSLMRLLLLVLSGSATRTREIIGGSLPLSLRRIISRPFYYGGSLFAIACSMTADIAHAEPTATSELVKAGICKALLKAVRLGLPPSGEAIRCVPNILAALCLAPAARDEVMNASPLHPYILRLATPFYGRAMHGETPVHIGNSLDELMRHVEALRTDGSKALIDFLKAAATFVMSENPPGLSLDLDVPTASTVSISEEATTREEPKLTDGEVCGDHTPGRTEKLILLDKMRLTVANNAARLAGFTQGSSEHQSAMVRMEGLQHLLDLRHAPATAIHIPSSSVGSSAGPLRIAPSPSNTIVSLVNSFRSFFARHGPAVLRCIFDAVKQDASKALSMGSQLEGMWLDEEEASLKSRTSLHPHLSSSSDEAHHGTSGGVVGPSDTLPLHGRSDGEIANQADESATAKRIGLRRELMSAIRRLRVAVVILTGLSRSGPGSPAGTWEAASGSQVASLIAAVERSARFHLSIVYTGLTLQTTQEGDLSSAVVSAAADPSLRPFPGDIADQLVRRYARGVGLKPSEVAMTCEAVKKRKIPPGPTEPIRQEVSSDAWALVTFAVAAQRLYSTLSRNLTVNTRRFSRDHSGYGSSTKSLAGTLGRIFALHLKAAEPLWDRTVISSGGGRVVAAWDYIRGVLIEIRGCIFDESRRVTQSLILRSFLAAGGGHALLTSCRPSALFTAAIKTAPSVSDVGTKPIIDEKLRKIIPMLSEQDTSGPLQSFYGAVGTVVVTASEVCQSLHRREAAGTRLLAPRPALPQDGDWGQDVNDLTADTIMAGSPSVEEVEARQGDVTGRELPCEKRLLLGQVDLERAEAALRAAHVFMMECNKRNAVHTAALDTWNTMGALTQLLASCPGLSIEPSGAPQSASLLPLSDGWTARDLHRSAQAVAIGLVSDVVSQRPTVDVSAPVQDVVLSDIVSIVQAISSSSKELSQDEQHQGSVTRRTGRSRTELRNPDPPTPVPATDPSIVANLVEMGFSEDRATEAVRRTHPGGLEYAMEWLLAHPENADDGDGDVEDSDGPEDDGEGDVDDEDDEDAEIADDMDDDEMDDDVEDGHDNHSDEAGEEFDTLPQSSIAGERSSRFDELAAALPETDPVPETRIPSVDTEQNSVVPESLAGTQSDPVMSDAELGIADANASPGTEQVNPALQPASNTRDLDASTSDERPRNMDEMLLELFPLGSGQGRPDRDLTGTGDIHAAAVSVADKGMELLQASAAAEISDLTLALERTNGVSGRTPNTVLKEMGELLSTEVSDVKSAMRSTGTAFRSAKSVSQSVFVESKTKLFETLESLVRALIGGSMVRKGALGFPPSAMEILGAMEVDGFLTGETRDKYANVISDGLRSSLGYLASEAATAESEERMFSFLHNACVWVHHGGFETRVALLSCGVDDIACQFLGHECSYWKHYSEIPNFEEDTVRPIQKLSIREREAHVPIDSSKSAAPESAQHRPMTTTHPRRLRHLTACLLLIDGFVRYSEMDRARVIASARLGKSDASEHALEDASELHVDLSKSVIAEDAVGGSDLASTDTRNVGFGIGTDGAENDMELSSIGSTVANTGVDEVSCCGDDAELSSVKSLIRRAKGEALQSIQGQLRVLLECPQEEQVEHAKIMNTLPLESLLGHCMILLRAWVTREVGDALPALLQLLAALTSYPEIASKFWKEGGLPLVLGMPQLDSRKVSSTDPRLVRAYVRTIIRHVVEDPETLREGMETDIRAVLSAKSNLGRPLYTTRALLSETAAIAHRSVPIFLLALSNTAQLEADSESVETLPDETQDVELRTKVGRMERANVRAVIEALVSLLVDSEDRERPSSGKLPKSKATSSLPEKDVAVHDTVPAVATSDVAVFALNVISELVALFPACAAVFVESRARCNWFDGSALDYILRVLLPMRNVRDISVSPAHVRYPDGISDACRELFRALCSRAARSYFRAVQALADATLAEFSSPKPRASAAKSFALCVTQNLQPRVMRALVESGLGDSLALCLSKFDLNADGMSEMVSAVLRALEELGRAALDMSTSQTAKGSEEDEDGPTGSAGDEIIATGRVHMGRRYARSVFESLQNSELNPFDPF